MNTLQRLCRTQDRYKFLLQELRPLPNVLSMIHHNGGAETRNIVIPFGKSPYRLIIGAHYDAFPKSPAANDNGAAVVELLALARRLHDCGHDRDLAIVFFDKEENLALGKPESEMGSFCFAHHLNAMGITPELVLILDVSGAGDTLFFSASRNDAHRHPRLVEVFGNKVRSTPPSDNVIFQRAGIPAALLCALPADEFSSSNWPPTWGLLHTSGDTPATVSVETMKRVADLLGELARRF